MKNQSEGYIVQEEATKKKPIELHRIWRDGGEEWRYTTRDKAVFYGEGDPYVPATLQRSLVKWDSQLEVTVCHVQAASLELPFLEFIAINPIEILWYSIMRLHEDMEPWVDPLDVEVIFIGQIKSVSFKGIGADVELVGFEFFLSMPVPILRYQLTCNWALFESNIIDGITFGCRLNKETYKVSAPDTALDPTKLILTNAIFDDYDDGYFVGGTVEFENEDGTIEKRTIISHVGSVITMSYVMRGLTGKEIADVNVYPGCDGRPETCRDKFLESNIDNFLGFPFTPEDNPAIQMSQIEMY